MPAGRLQAQSDCQEFDLGPGCRRPEPGLSWVLGRLEGLEEGLGKVARVCGCACLGVGWLRLEVGQLCCERRCLFAKLAGLG